MPVVDAAFGFAFGGVFGLEPSPNAEEELTPADSLALALNVLGDEPGKSTGTADAGGGEGDAGKLSVVAGAFAFDQSGAEVVALILSR